MRREYLERENICLIKILSLQKQMLKMQAMTSFRNIAIHDYQIINLEILKTILVKHLKDIEGFYTKILLHFKFVKK
jgi:uncharacterized protein YutE (UPF0331/DUF86 family)